MFLVSIVLIISLSTLHALVDGPFQFKSYVCKRHFWLSHPPFIRCILILTVKGVISREFFYMLHADRRLYHCWVNVTENLKLNVDNEISQT